MKIKEENNKNLIKIGYNGTLYFTTNYNDNEKNVFNFSDIKERTVFNTLIKDEEDNSYNIECNLWKQTNGIINIFCDLNEKLKYEEQFIILDTAIFDYHNYTIIIYSNEYIKIKRLDYNVPFLYANEQNIVIEEENDYYDIIFNLGSYYDDILILSGEVYNYAVLDSCEKYDKELVCQITKEKLEEIMLLDVTKFRLGSINDNEGIINFDFVLDIIISINITKKEDIYIDIINSTSNYSETGTSIGLITNITSIPNLNTYLYKNISHFKKSENKALLLLFNFEQEQEFNLEKWFDDDGLINITDIHYKYNFIISPRKNNYIFNIKGNGTEPKLVYPQKLDFSSEKNKVIRYIMPSPSLAKNIKLNIESSDLECENLNGMKKCFVNIEHFDYCETAYFNTYHLNYENEIYYDSPAIQVRLPYINIKIKDIYNANIINIGLDGILYFESDYNDDEKYKIFNSFDIEEKTSFETLIDVDDNFTYSIQCRLWKPCNKNIKIFCELNNTLLDIGIHNIRISTEKFDYDNYIIIISYEGENIKVNQLESYIPLLYGDESIINIEEEEDNYDIKLKILSYHNELIILQGGSKYANLFLDNCNISEKELLCSINKDNIMEIMEYNGQKFSFISYNENLGLIKIETLYDLIINYNITEKEEIFIEITKLINTNANINSSIAYETNVSCIDNVVTKFFEFDFENTTQNCYLKKSINTNLTMICFINEEGNYTLGEISNITLEDIHIKYDFIFIEQYNYEVFNIDGEGSNIYINYPQILDFTLYNNITVELFSDNIESINGIKINLDSYELQCYDKLYKKECIVPKNHFELKQAGYYYIYHLNNIIDEYSPFYELTPLKIILPYDNELTLRIKNDDNAFDRIIGHNGIISFITDYNDNEKNIFDIFDIEEKTIFNTIIKDDNDNKYNVTCRLWKPLNDKMRIFCYLDENIIYGDCNINIVETTFEYKEYNITIIPEINYIKLIKINGSTPFLYSDTQIIDIKDDIEEYNITFNIELNSDSYNDELLYISGPECLKNKSGNY